MARSVVRLERKRQLFAKLRRLVPAVEGALATAAGQSANEMVGIARGFAPKRTGTLARAIYAQKVTGTATPVWKVAVDQGKGPTGVDAYYGFWVELATVDTPAQPFFFPAYRLVAKRHRSRVTRAINKEIRKLAVTR
jgi:hypothetical protein